MIPVPIQPEAPPLRTDSEGTIRVGTSRIPVERVIDVHHDGVSPKDFVEAFPTVTLADVYGVIAYYYRHREVMDAYLAGRERQAGELQQQIEAEYGSQDGLRQRLLDRPK